MLFSVDQRLLHCNDVEMHKFTSCPVSTCQMYKLARQTRLKNFLKVSITTGNIFIKPYCVINALELRNWCSRA